MRLSRRFALVGGAAALVPLLAYGAISITALREGTRQSVGTGSSTSPSARRRSSTGGWIARPRKWPRSLPSSTAAASSDGSRNAPSATGC